PPPLPPPLEPDGAFADCSGPCHSKDCCTRPRPSTVGYGRPRQLCVILTELSFVGAWVVRKKLILFHCKKLPWMLVKLWRVLAMCVLHATIVATNSVDNSVWPPNNNTAMGIRQAQLVHHHVARLYFAFRYLAHVLGHQVNVLCAGPVLAYLQGVVTRQGKHRHVAAVAHHAINQLATVHASTLFTAPTPVWRTQPRTGFPANCRALFRC